MGPADTTTVSVAQLANFTPKELSAWEAIWRYRYVLYGGARGGGKSRWLRLTLALFTIAMFQMRGLRGVRVGLFCEDYPTLRDRQISKIPVEFPLWMGEVHETQDHGLAFTLNDDLGGGIVALRNLDDASKYQSAEFAAIGVDELTKNRRAVFDVLRGSLRWPGVEHTWFAGATNPGGRGHGWVKQLWIDRNFPPELQEKAEQFTFIRALPQDNPYLPPSYWEELNSLPEELRRAWVEGDWSVFEGQAFTQWRYDLHTCEPFTIPAHWLRFRGVDWGSTAPWCCLWGAKDPDTKRIYVYREAYQVGLTDRQQAETILDWSATDGQIAATYADPSLWAPKEVKDIVTSSADQYAAAGVPLLKADNNRLSGKRKVERLLENLPDGRPGIVVFRNCTNLIRTLPDLARDDRNVEDVDTDQEDHAYDALRYLLTQAQAQASAEQRQEQLPWLRRKSPLERVSNRVL